MKPQPLHFYTVLEHIVSDSVFLSALGGQSSRRLLTAYKGFLYMLPSPIRIFVGRHLGEDFLN